MWKKAMTYLGLGPDDDYEEYDAPVEVERPAPRPATRSYPPQQQSEAMGTVRTIPARPGPVPRDPQRVRETSSMARPPMGMEQDVPSVTMRSRSQSTVRTVPAAASAKPYTVRPRQFNQAQEVADKFKDGQPVIVNLQDVDRDLSRRLIDFASGLCYGLGGTMEKVANGVYLLTPANVSVSAEDKRLMGEPALSD